MSLTVAYLLGAATAAAAGSCPSVGVQSDFNLTEYIRSTWYIQQQQVTEYEPATDNFCVTATYVKGKKTVPFFSGEVLSVYNYANGDKVNGANQNSEALVLCARVPDPSQPAKLLVAPCFLPNVLAGDYWVIAAGPSPSNYEWAIVSGGNPTVPDSSGGCTTKTTGTNGAGFWLFTRSQQPGEATISMMRELAQKAGFGLSKLNPVAQQGCSYEGSLIKKDGDLTTPIPKTKTLAESVGSDISSGIESVFIANKGPENVNHVSSNSAVATIGSVSAGVAVAIAAFVVYRRNHLANSRVQELELALTEEHCEL